MRRVLVPIVLVLAGCNAAPEGGALTIQPANPRTTDALQAVLTEDAVDPNGKDTVAYTYAWTVDGAAANDVTTDTVPAARTARDQVWAVTVTPTDGKKDGESLTATTTIENTPPVIPSVQILPAGVQTDGTVNAVFTPEDADDDTVTATIAWTVNGTAAGTGESLTGDVFDKGDSISVTVTPDDGTDVGEPVTAGPLVVGNTPPTVPVAALTPAEPTPATPLRCLLDTPSTDVDEDVLVYRANWELDGLEYTGTLETTDFDNDTVPASALAVGQVWTCRIIVDDGDATATSALAGPVTVALPPGVAYQAGYYWVLADYAAPASDHAAICASKGLTATDYEVTLTWDETLLGTLSADFGYASAGDDDCCAHTMWCWDGGGSPSNPTEDGECETHNFGTYYENYGLYSSSEFVRPVFTCTD